MVHRQNYAKPTPELRNYCIKSHIHTAKCMFCAYVDLIAFGVLNRCLVRKHFFMGMEG